MSYSSDRDKAIQAAAAQALADIPADAKPSLAAAHGTLFSWLIGMDAACRDPAALVKNNDLGPAVHAFTKAMTMLSAEAHTAWAALSEEQQSAAVGDALRAYVQSKASGAQLMTRSQDGTFWDVTGFVADGKPATVAAKVGNRPYQPIGYDDGVHYVATEGSKTLWAREFGFALMLPYPPPFKVSRDEVIRKERTGALSETEIKGMKAAIGWLEDELHQYRQVSEAEAKPEAERRLRDTLDLARINVPRLDTRMTKLSQEHTELGLKLEKADPVQLTTAAMEFMRMLLADTEIGDKIASTTLVADGDKANALLDSVRARLQAVLTVDGVTDADEAVAAVVLAKQSLPKVAELVDTSDKDELIHVTIQRILEVLSAKAG